MRGYELCIIIHPDAGETDIDGIISSLSESISKHKGRVLKTDKWGRKNFKYQIKKQSKGYYCFIYYTGNTETIRDIERLVKFNESILRYNTIRMEKKALIDEVEKAAAVVEKAAAEAEKAAAEAEKVEAAQAPEPVTKEETKGEEVIESKTVSEDDSESPSEPPAENKEEVTPESNE